MGGHFRLRQSQGRPGGPSAQPRASLIVPSQRESLGERAESGPQEGPWWKCLVRAERCLEHPQGSGVLLSWGGDGGEPCRSKSGKGAESRTREHRCPAFRHSPQRSSGGSEEKHCWVRSKVCGLLPVMANPRKPTQGVRPSTPHCCCPPPTPGIGLQWQSGRLPLAVEAHRGIWRMSHREESSSAFLNLSGSLSSHPG